MHLLVVFCGMWCLFLLCCSLQSLQFFLPMFPCCASFPSPWRCPFDFIFNFFTDIPLWSLPRFVRYWLLLRPIFWDIHYRVVCMKDCRFGSFPWSYSFTLILKHKKHIVPSWWPFLFPLWVHLVLFMRYMVSFYLPYSNYISVSQSLFLSGKKGLSCGCQFFFPPFSFCPMFHTSAMRTGLSLHNPAAFLSLFWTIMKVRLSKIFFSFGVPIPSKVLIAGTGSYDSILLEWFP